MEAAPTAAAAPPADAAAAAAAPADSAAAAAAPAAAAARADEVSLPAAAAVAPAPPLPAAPAETAAASPPRDRVDTPPSTARLALAAEPGLYDNLVTSIWLDWRNLQGCPEVVRADRQVVREAMKASKGEAIQYAAEELRADRDMVLEAAGHNGLLLQYASEELRADKAFVLQLCELDGRALKYVSAELRNDREVVLTAVRQHGAALSDASDELLGDYELLLAATEKDMVAFRPKPPPEHRRVTGETRVMNEDIERYKAAEADARKPVAAQDHGELPALRSDYDVLLESFGRLAKDLNVLKVETDRRDAKFDYLSKTC